MYRSCSWCELVKREFDLTSIVYWGDRLFLCGDCLRRARELNENQRRVAECDRRSRQHSHVEASRAFAETDYYDGVQRGPLRLPGDNHTAECAYPHARCTCGAGAVDHFERENDMAGMSYEARRDLSRPTEDY